MLVIKPFKCYQVPIGFAVWILDTFDNNSYIRNHFAKYSKEFVGIILSNISQSNTFAILLSQFAHCEH